MTKRWPLSNAERQRKRRESGPRPQMSVTVSRWVQAAVDALAEEDGEPTSAVWERAGEWVSSDDDGVTSSAMTLTPRGAALLGACLTCGKALRSGDRVRRAGEFARHEGCPEKS